MTTPEAAQMAAIVRVHVPLLKSAGFRKRRHCFNRSADDGLIHVVYFWMAPKEPPAWTEVPGLRERRYGSFRLDFGIYVPEMTRTHRPRRDWINDYDCHLRRTIGQLVGSDGDLWWRLDDPGAATVAGAAVTRHGLPWLDSVPDRRALVETFERQGPLPLGMGPAGWLDMADLYRATGDKINERHVLEDYVSRPVLPTHVEYLANYLRGHGHGDLLALITSS